MTKGAFKQRVDIIYREAVDLLNDTQRMYQLDEILEIVKNAKQLQVTASTQHPEYEQPEEAW